MDYVLEFRQRSQDKIEAYVDDEIVATLVCRPGPTWDVLMDGWQYIATGKRCDMKRLVMDIVCERMRGK